LGRLIALLALACCGVAHSAPQRVASLNLCTDELLLLLAKPGQIASVTRLAADPAETELAPRAKGLHLNDGRMESLVRIRPGLVVTGGFTNAYAGAMARRLGYRVVDVPPPQSLADVRRNVRTVAAALGTVPRGEALIAAMDASLGPVPAQQRPVLILTGGGYVPRADGLAAAYLRHAGLTQQNLPSGRADLERLLADPPAVVITSRYRSAQTSRHQMWLAHPALRALPATTRRMDIDGRAWLCGSPLVARQIAALRTAG
jgi:iron complex transport system substrate-binding protein